MVLSNDGFMWSGNIIDELGASKGVELERADSTVSGNGITRWGP